jgi:hypothetical protein
MPTETPLPGRLTDNPGAIGYQSPGLGSLKAPDQCINNSGIVSRDGTGRHGGRYADGHPYNPALHEYINPQTEGQASRMAVLGQQSDEDCMEKRYGIRDRVGCFTWTWFTITMATGGIANVLHASEYE